MLKMSLLHAVCGVALLASVPAFAENPGGGLVSTTGVLNPEAQQPTSGPLAPQNNGANAASMASLRAEDGSSEKRGTKAFGKSGRDFAAIAHKHPMHHEATGGKTDSSQDAAIDHLNDQSFKAATQGEAFTVAGTEPSAPVHSGSMTNPTK
jgi:hypothetical protein